MRSWIAGALVGLVGLTAPAVAEVPQAAEREALRGSWHRCVREAFAGQPASLDRQAAERAALTNCKAFEDSYVAAELAVRQAEDEARRKGTLATRAKNWMSSVAAYVVDPVAGFLNGIGR